MIHMNKNHAIPISYLSDLESVHFIK
jgi:hypothetical protein